MGSYLLSFVLTLLCLEVAAFYNGFENLFFGHPGGALSYAWKWPVFIMLAEKN